ncbi:WhiB family transcriptional regulator [Rhodococcus sp. LB1]|uniref:WhiB family transcriptional regulator n=1 Tax=Rhodococcus sp. LB1 TaxID=1807499 RepID=UPI001E4A6509|nr:WhiB family transcriptional regulator [Rhodococcus sp. LB1]
MKAANVCATCPVVAACREHALTQREPFCIWGGLSEEDRAALLSKRRSQPRIDTLR